MDYTFSDKTSALKPSAIREILKAASIPGMIPFAAGNPAPETFPTGQIAQITERILREQPIPALQYGVTEGVSALLSEIKTQLVDPEGIGSDNDAMLVTSGAQQVMDLAAKVLCNEGDTVICENPSFIGSLNCFRSYNANLVGVDLEADGINIELLEDALKREKNVRFIYVIPNFQNPSGVTMSVEKRRAVYALAKKYNTLILEDNPYGALRVRGEFLPSIKSMDADGRVIYAGSLSKILAPGLRVGFALAPKEIIAKMTVGKQTSDVHTPILSQMLACEWLRETDLQGHFMTIRDIYRRKMDLMCDLIDSEMRGFFRFQRPEGGLFVWCELPQGVDMLKFCKRALKRMVAVVPGTAFSVDENRPSSCVRMNFSTPADDRIIEGMKVLGKLRERYEKHIAAGKTDI